VPVTPAAQPQTSMKSPASEPNPMTETPVAASPVPMMTPAPVIISEPAPALRPAPAAPAAPDRGQTLDLPLSRPAMPAGSPTEDAPAKMLPVKPRPPQTDAALPPADDEPKAE
jgi:hypothetical protein